MSKDFELVADFAPAGDQPQAIQELIDGLMDGEAGMTLLGVTGSGKTYTIANLYLRHVVEGREVGEVLVVIFTNLGSSIGTMTAVPLMLKTGLAEMLKGGVIMDVTTADQAKIAGSIRSTGVMTSAGMFRRSAAFLRLSSSGASYKQYVLRLSALRNEKIHSTPTSSLISLM